MAGGEVPTHLVGVRRVHPGHLERVLYLVGKADAGTAVGGNVDAGNAFSPRQLRGPQEDQVLLWPKGANLVCDVIANEHYIPAFWILGGLELHFESNHPHLPKTAQGRRAGSSREMGSELVTALADK